MAKIFNNSVVIPSDYFCGNYFSVSAFYHHIDDMMIHKVTINSVSSLPITKKITPLNSSSYLVYYILSNPSAQTSDWTVATPGTSSQSVTNTQLTISGSISGTTDITLYFSCFNAYTGLSPKASTKTMNFDSAGLYFNSTLNNRAISDYKIQWYDFSFTSSGGGSFTSLYSQLDSSVYDCIGGTIYSGAELFKKPLSITSNSSGFTISGNINAGTIGVYIAFVKPIVCTVTN